MTIKQCDFRAAFERYLTTSTMEPLFLCGDALEILRLLPSESIDFCMTSPPIGDNDNIIMVVLAWKSRQKRTLLSI